MERQAIKILAEMINDRKYTIDYLSYENQEDFKNNEEEDNQNHRNNEDLKDDNDIENIEPFCIRGRKGNDVILCFLSNEDKLNIQGIKDRISVMNREGSTRCIIVYRSSVTSSAKKSLETLEYDFELFSMKELQLNITKHRLVPRHTIVTDSEKEELDSKYKGKLPSILQNDAVCRYYAFQKGDYVRITRKNGSIIYRVVK
jgi:DNA-directed RNA polymerase I, II, and III subunit RPABC1